MTQYRRIVRIAALEAARAAAALRDPGPDASDFERLVYRIRRTVADAGRTLDRQQAEAKARELERAVAEIDAIEHGATA